MYRAVGYRSLLVLLPSPLRTYGLQPPFKRPNRAGYKWMSTEKVTYTSAEEERRWNHVRRWLPLMDHSHLIKAGVQAEQVDELLPPVVQGRM